MEQGLHTLQLGIRTRGDVYQVPTNEVEYDRGKHPCQSIRCVESRNHVLQVLGYWTRRQQGFDLLHFVSVVFVFVVWGRASELTSEAEGWRQVGHCKRFCFGLIG